MNDLLNEMECLRKSMESVTPQAHETANLEWLYDLIESLTNTCMRLTESCPDDAARELHGKIVRSIAIYPPKSAKQ